MNLMCNYMGNHLKVIKTYQDHWGIKRKEVTLV